MNRYLIFAIGTLLLTIGARAADNSHSKLTLFFAGQGLPADGSRVNGSSAKLTRGDGVVWVRVNTTGLPPGAYTNWWIIFNNPDACAGGAGGCAGSDLGNPDVEGGVLFATGGVVDSSGVGHFRAHLEELETRPAGQRGPVFAPLKSGGAQDSEIHYVLKWHGPASSDSIVFEKQISTIYGGCIGGPGQGPDPVIVDRIFACFDPQATALPFP